MSLSQTTHENPHRTLTGDKRKKETKTKKSSQESGSFAKKEFHHEIKKVREKNS